MNLNHLQDDVDRWIRESGGYWSKFQILAHLTEELGEVAAALQTEAGLRPRGKDHDIAEELGDLLFTLAALANVCDVKLDEAATRVLGKYRDRDGTSGNENP